MKLLLVLRLSDPNRKNARFQEPAPFMVKKKGGAMNAPPLFNALAAIGIKSWQTGYKWGQYKWGQCLILAIFL
jgi:hypothetical protein